MCGIVGIISKAALTDDQRAVFAWMWYFNKTRGLDSAGVMWGAPGKRTRVLKGVGSTEDLWNNKAAESALTRDGVLKDKTATFAVAHNRKKTIGAVTANNAHPFRHGNVVGVHNGFVRSGLQTLGVKNEEVDSSMVIAALGAGTTIDELEQKLSFAYTLVWHDGDKQTLNLARNHERPLVFCQSNVSGCTLFASEEWMITQALAAERETSRFGVIRSLAVLTHVSVPIANPGVLDNRSYAPKPLPPVAPVVRQVESQFNRAANKVTPNNLGIGVHAWYAPPKMDQELFDAKTGCHCSFCSEAINYAGFEAGYVKFLMPDYAICNDCVIATEAKV